TAAASKRTVGLTQLRRAIFSTIPGFALGAAVPMVCRGHSCKGWTGELALVRAPAGPRRWDHMADSLATIPWLATLPPEQQQPGLGPGEAPEAPTSLGGGGGGG